MGDLALSYTMLGRCEDAITCLLICLSPRLQVGMPNRVESGLLSQLADIYNMDGNYGLAITTAKKALALAKVADYQMGEYTAYRCIGVAYVYTHKLDLGIEYTHKGLVLALQAGDREIQITSYRLLGVAHRLKAEENQHTPALRLLLLRKALDFATKSFNMVQETGESMAGVHNRIADVYEDMGQYEKAAEHRQLSVSPVGRV